MDPAVYAAANSTPIKAQAIADNASKASDLVHQHKVFSRAVQHLNDQTERAVKAPHDDWAPASSDVAV